MLPEEAALTMEEFQTLPSMLDMTKEQVRKLSIVHIGVDSKVVQADKAPTSNMRKASLVRASWRHTAIEEDMAIEEDVQVKKAFSFLRECNAVYDDYVRQWHDEATQRAQQSSYWIESAQLLLKHPGVEMEYAPWLYLFKDWGDTNVACRKGSAKEHPSMKTSFMRKVQSRVAEYNHDFRLQSLVYDISLAKSLKAKLTIAEGKDAALETLTEGNHMFDSYGRCYRETAHLHIIANAQ